MNPLPSVDPLSDHIRRLFRADPAAAALAIETLLAQRLAGMPENERKAMLEALAGKFGGALPSAAMPDAEPDSEKEEEVLNRIFSLLLGRQISTDNLSSMELMERLSESLNTIFSTLNRLVQNINTTLLGDAPSDQTIRHVIGSQMEGQEAQETLETYLGRIDKAFFISHQAFRQAAHTTVLKIIRELDPEKIASEGGQGLKFGPMRKAEYFEIFEAKFLKLKKWFESGRFMEDLLREFENNCQTGH